MLHALETAAVRIAKANGGVQVEAEGMSADRAGAVTLWVEVGTVYLSALCGVHRCAATRRDILTVALGDQDGAERLVAFAFGTPVVGADGQAGGRLGGARSARRDLICLMQAAKAAPHRLDEAVVCMQAAA